MTEINVSDLLKVKNPLKCFDWFKAIKYSYKEDDNLIVDMFGQQLNYCYELESDNNRLVFTKLTDKCYTNLITGIIFNYFVNLVGPAGTGKTESIKSFAKMFGKLILVFNCGDGMSVESFSYILIAIHENTCMYIDSSQSHRQYEFASKTSGYFSSFYTCFRQV